MGKGIVMAVLDFRGVRRSQAYRTGVTATGETPDNTTDRAALSVNTDKVEVYIHYNGAVTAANIELWILDNGTWYRGTDTAAVQALVPTTGGNEVRTFYGLAGKVVAFVVKARTGGTSIDMRLRPVK